jgi:hypothetical protein
MLCHTIIQWAIQQFVDATLANTNANNAIRILTGPTTAVNLNFQMRKFHARLCACSSFCLFRCNGHHRVNCLC